MIHMVMFSGGAGSWAAAKRVVATHGKENVVLVFADTLMEDEDLYRFIQEAAENVGAPLLRLADGRTPWQVFEDVRYIGNTRVDPCSRVLKRELLDRYRDTWLTPATGVIHVGLSWWEAHRFERLVERVKPWVYQAPMMDPPHLDPEEVLTWMTSEGLRPPRLYEMGFSHNNCGGFCVKAGQASFALLLNKMPERYAIHEAHEKRLRALGINGTILRDRRGKKTRGMTLQQFRVRIQDGEGFDANDVGGCGCALVTE